MTRTAAAVPNLNIHLSDELSRSFFRKAAPQLKKLMKQSRSRITLAVDNLPAEYMRSFERMLRRLSKYRDRVFVELSEATRERLTIDLSGFNLVLVPVAVK